MAAPITNYISIGSPTGFSSSVNSSVQPDGSVIDWYIGAFQANNTVTFLNTIDLTDVYVLLVAGGGGGGGGTNVVSAAAGQGGGGAGHMLVRFPNGSPSFPTGTTYSVNVGLGGNGGVGTGVAGDGGHTIFGSNVFGANAPDVSGGGGGQSASGNASNNFGAIVQTGASSGFEVLNDQNSGGGGRGGAGTSPSSTQPGGGENGNNAVPVNQDWGFPGAPGEYYLGPPFGLFGRLKVGGGGGGGGGYYDASGTVSGFIGEGGRAGQNGIGGQFGGYRNSAQSSNFSDGQAGTASTAISFIFGNSYQFGAGGGGSGQPNTLLGSASNSATGGDGAQGVLVFWFTVLTPASLSTPYYTITYASTFTETISRERIFTNGAKETHYFSVLVGGVGNSITFEPSSVGISAELLLVGGGGGGGGGMNQNFTFTGQGGGGGGSIFGYVIPGIDVSVGTNLPIELGQNGFSGGGANPGGPGGPSYLDRFAANPTHVTGGNGGAAPNGDPSINGAGGQIISAGRINQTAGGNGGNGGAGGVGTYTSSTVYTTANGQTGGSAANGNTGFSGLYEFPTFGAIAVGGGGGGGGGFAVGTNKINDASGGGGAAGYGSGGVGGTSPFVGTWDNTSSFNGGTNSGTVGTMFAHGGNGGGGGGNPYTPGGQSIQAFGGTGGLGLFAVHLSFYEEAPPPPPPPSFGYQNEYFAYEYDSSALYVQVVSTGEETTCQCGAIRPKIEYVTVAETDNRLRFFPAAVGLSAEFILIGAGGQGGGGINSAVRQPGQGGGGGGIAYATSTIGNEVLPDISYDIALGYNLNTGGLGTSAGSDGSGSWFGANVWNPWMEVTGASGGGVTVSQGQGGTVISYGPLIGGVGGSGGTGGLQDPSGNGLSGQDAALTPSGLPGKYVYPSYGFIIGAGGGGGGAGVSGIDSSGSGGLGGRGTGGPGGTLLSLPFDGSYAETEVGIGVSVGGGGGGGAGMPSLAEAVSYGGDAGKGLFAMILTEAEICNPVDPICGCLKQKPCPDPVDYKKLVTAGNDPRFNPAINYALQVRGSLGRPGYQKVNYGNNPLNAFGSYAGAPGGSRAPPRNKFN